MRYDANKEKYTLVIEDCVDEIGHGTAIVDIISKNVSGITIDMYKIYGKEFEIEESVLINMLQCISEKNDYDILHISSGIVQPGEFEKLLLLCKTIADYGTIIVAAYDNDGSISYPAAFPFVIGVDLSDNKLGVQDYEFVEDSIVNIRASSSFHRLKWIKQPVILAQGTSFS